VAQERVEDIISKEALDSFDTLKAKVEQSTASLDKLIAQGVELNKTFSRITGLKELIDKTDQLSDNQSKLTKTTQQLAQEQSDLQKAIDARKKSSDAARQSTVDEAKAANDSARAASAQATSLRELVEQSVRVTNALKSIAAERKKLDDQFKTGIITTQQYEKSLADLLQTETSLKATGGDLKTAIKNVSREAESAAGSINQLESQLKVAQQAFKTMSDEEKKSAEGVELQQKIRGLSDEVNKQKKSIGDFSSNVGRYAESLGGLFDGVVSEIKRLNGLKVTAANVGDPAAVNKYERAITELEKIEKIGLNTNNSYTQSVRQLQKEFINVSSNGNQSTEFVKKFRDEVGEAVDKQNDLRQEIKLAASDTKTFDLLRSGVTGLVGAYQTGIGVVSLFGDATEENEKVIRKLVAVQSVANGIQEIGQQLTEHNTAAYRALAYVQGLYRVAVDSSATATVRLGAALKLTAIGALIALVAYLVINFDKLFKTVDPLISEIDKLDGVTTEAKESLKAYGDTAEKITEGVLKKLQDQVKSLNDELKLTPTAAEDAKNQINSLKLASERLVAQNEKLKKQKVLDQGTAILITQNEEALADYNSQIQKLVGGLSSFNVKQGLKDILDFQKEVFKVRVQDLKDIQDKNNRESALQKTSLERRLTLTTLNYTAEKEIIQKTLDEEIKQAQKNYAKEFAAKEKARSANLKADRDYADQTAKINKEIADRDAKAQSDIQQRLFNARIDFNKKIADSDKELPEIRIQALRNGLQAELQLLNEQQKRELAVDGLRKEEQSNINDKYNQQRVKAEEETSKKIFDIQVEFFSKFKGNQESLLAAVTKQLADYAEEVKRLFKEIGRDVSHAEFANQIAEGIKEANSKIKRNFDDFGESISDLFPRQAGQAVDDYNEQIKKLEGNLRELKTTGVDLVFSLQEDSLERQKNAIQDQINLIDKRRDTDIAAIQASQRSEEEKANAIAVINGTADAQKREQERKQKEIDRKKAQLEKQASIARIVQSTAEAVLAALGEKPYKATNIANASIIGAIGLAQLAKVISTPVPQYAEGTTFHPGGKAIVGDGGMSELVVTPQGRLVETPALPTLMDLQRGSIVLPDAKAAMADYYGGMTLQKYSEMQNDSSVVNEIRKLTKVVKGKQETHWHRKINTWEFVTNNDGNYQKWLERNL
jgi:hypothetical protein